MENPTPKKSGGEPPSLFGELNRLVFDYLEITGMSTTLDAFASECELKSIHCPPKEGKFKSTFSKTDSNKILQSFDRGDEETFLQTWQLFLSHIQITSDDMKKLEVYLHVYFGIWPKATKKPEVEQVKAMSRLRSYFEENSGELSKDPTILPLFALPFVNDPKDHPVFKELFQDAWRERLRSQLEATLSKYFELLQENIAFHSKLAAVVLKAQNGNQEHKCPGIANLAIQYHQERFFQLMTTYRKVRKLLRGTRESYGKLLKVSSELISGLEEVTGGEVVKIQPTIERCYNIFPELFLSEKDPNGKPDMEYFKRLAGAAIFKSALDSDVSLFFLGISDIGPESLNYPKIKETLVSNNVSQSEKLCLLQAIRWLLTKTFPKFREEAMDCFIEADLLGLESKDKEFRTHLFTSMLTQTPTYSKECFSRLLNAFASIKKGRTYLSSSTFTLDLLISSLLACKSENESYICQMLIATLQKMSLRKQMRLGMIERKVIQWLAVYLKSELIKSQPPPETEENANVEVAYNPYLMEYGWALLMNLSLHDEAKPESSEVSSEILDSVTQMLLANPAPDVAPYVVSTLYSLLRNPDIFALAKRIHLHEVLAEIVGNSKSEMALHLRKLVEVLNMKGCDRITTTGEVDYDDDDNADPDEFEPELEVTEAWTTSLDPASYVGDDLLVREYLIQREVILPETPLPKSQGRGGVHIRPTTPKSQFVAQDGTKYSSASHPIKSPRQTTKKGRQDAVAERARRRIHNGRDGSSLRTSSSTSINKPWSPMSNQSSSKGKLSSGYTTHGAKSKKPDKSYTYVDETAVRLVKTKYNIELVSSDEEEKSSTDPVPSNPKFKASGSKDTLPRKLEEATVPTPECSNSTQT